MSSISPVPDRDAFQQFLANAYAVQESHIDRQMLSAIMEVQRMITRGDLGVDGAMNLIVDSAREVSNASGVAIGLLEGHQLIYRAGSGCSSTCVGSHVTASFTVSPNTRTSREILRVEDARNDRRIEASICRQLGAESLLILPIYNDRVLAGVLEVLFGEAHTFEDREVRTYRLMAGLVETALTFADTNVAPAPAPVPPQPETTVSPESSGFLTDYSSLSRSRWEDVFVRGTAALASAKAWAGSRGPQSLAKLKVARAWAASRKPKSFSHLPASLLASRKLADFSVPGWRRNTALAAGTGLLLLTAWIAYPTGSSSQGTASDPASMDSYETGDSFKAATDDPSVDKDPAGSPAKPGRFGRKVVRQSPAAGYEVSHYGDDVTVRRFSPKTSSVRRTAAQNRVSYIGKDVTVRYFATGAPEKTKLQ